MLKNHSNRSSATGRGQRKDGLATRQQILEVAGQVFARRGYADATSKEICERAGANAPAVNYYFGGKEGLYAAVLTEAQHRLVTVEELSALAQSRQDARQKLRAFLTRILGELSRTRPSSWEFRVLSREFLSPSPLRAAMLKTESAPRVRVLRSIVAEIMRVPVTHPAVARSVINVFAPCLLLLIGNRAVYSKLLPDIELDPEELAQHMLNYALAGLEAAARQVRAAS